MSESEKAKRSYKDLRKEDFVTAEGKPIFPWITYQEYVEEWLTAKERLLGEDVKQMFYKKTLMRTFGLFKYYNPTVKLEAGFDDEALRLQGIEPLKMED